MSSISDKWIPGKGKVSYKPYPVIFLRLFAGELYPINENVKQDGGS